MVDARRLVCALVLTAATTAMAGSHEIAGDWQFKTPLGDARGRLLIMIDETAGSWRLELLVDEGVVPPTRDHLLRRHGRGWTFCGSAGQAFVQTWSEAWREVGPRTEAFLAALVRLPLARSRQQLVEPRRSMLRSWRELPESWRPPSRTVGRRGDLRRRMIERGLGGGGDGLVVTARRCDEGLELTSRRWPVTVTLGALTLHEDRWELPAEAFLPLWPLVDVLP